MFKYYVYAYLREDGTPYYIGKGCGRRVYSKDHEVNLPKDKSKIVFLETGLSNLGALALERRYIRWYGRKDLGTGILRNKTDGGDNPPTLSGEAHPQFGKFRSMKSREKQSLSLKGRPLTKEHILKRTQSQTGLIRTKITKLKISKAMSKSVLCLNTGVIYQSMIIAEQIYNVSHQNISNCCQGKRKSAGKHPVTGEKLRWAYA